jgi:competence protein ComEA
MNSRQNNFGSCAVFKALNRCARFVLVRGFLGGTLALVFCQAALALDINQANEAELDSIKGMGPALSTKVLKARAKGPFKDWPDLMHRVSGIRQNKAQQFSEQGLTINGQAFIAMPK